MTAAVAAERLNSGSTSVDDELADMDRAIEEAASQIEVRVGQFLLGISCSFLNTPVVGNFVLFVYGLSNVIKRRSVFF